MNGSNVEHSLETALSALGAKTSRSDELDHLYKLDFVITHFEGIPRFRPIGVQVTTMQGNRSKMNEFAGKQRGAVPRAVYLELLGVEAEAWVAPVVYAALLNHANLRDAPAVIGLRVSHEGLEWFQVAITHAPKGFMLRGKIKRINVKGYGFILADSGETFFYHATDIKDAGLLEIVERNQKMALPWYEVNLPVEFTCNGFERDGATQQSAQNVHPIPEVKNNDPC